MVTARRRRRWWKCCGRNCLEDTGMSKPKLEEAKDRRLKILHIAGWYPSKKNPVAGVFVREHAKATALYNDVVVLYSEGVDREIHNFIQIEDNVEDSIRTLQLRYKKSPIPKTSYFIYLRGMFKAFHKLVNDGFRPDVIHAHVYSAGVPAVLLGKRYGIPVVITEHSSEFPRRRVRGVNKLKAKFAFENASVVCPVSENLKKHIESYRIRAQFQVVPNVVDTSLFSPNYNAGNESQEERKHILLVALLTPIKGLPYLLEALARLKKKRDDFILDIVGDGPNRSEYEELTNKLGLRDIVSFHGLKTKQEVAEFMRQCDFFVLSSLWENLPCVLIEAMASGLPIVATKVGGIHEIINEKVGVLVPPKDVKALTEAIDHMLDHYQDYSAREIAEYAFDRFSYEAVGRQLNEIYKELIANKKQS